MKLQFFFLPVSMAKLGLLLGMGAIGVLHGQEHENVKQETAKAAEKPSWFEEDKDGVLWFRKGMDGQTAHSAALILSGKNDGITIAVTANKEHIEKAVKLASRMQVALQKNQRTPDKIPIVVWSDQVVGVGYTFYTDGVACDHKSIGKQGTYSPAEAKQVLGHVAEYFRVLRDDFAAKGRWGADQKDWKALKIVKTEAAPN